MLSNYLLEWFKKRTFHKQELKYDFIDKTFLLIDTANFVDINTGESLSEALILVSTNPKYMKRLFIYLPVQYIKTTSSVGRTYCVHTLFWISKQKQKTICVHNMFSPCSGLVVLMYWTGKSMNNLLSYCGLFMWE